MNVFSRLDQRTIDDLEIIDEELFHVKGLSHLSSMVKQELATVLIFEVHPFKDELSKIDGVSIKAMRVNHSQRFGATNE